MTALAPELYSIDAAGEAAWPFVLTTWLRSYESSEWARSMGRGVFHHHHHAIAERLLRSCELTLATSADGVYLGWSLRAPSLLHYVYVKQQFRRLGIGLAMISGMEPGYRYSHRTSDWRKFERDNVYNPYLIGAAE